MQKVEPRTSIKIKENNIYKKEVNIILQSRARRLNAIMLSSGPKLMNRLSVIPIQMDSSMQYKRMNISKDFTTE